MIDSVSSPAEVDSVRYGNRMHEWFLQWAFCAKPASIVSGAVMERIGLGSYAIYVFFMCALIYPVVVANTWGGGLIAGIYNKAYIDFAGSGVVHLTGGIGALAGAITLGPRKGRFDESVDQAQISQI